MPKRTKKHRTPLWKRPGWQTVSRERKGPYVSNPSDFQDILSTFDCRSTPEQLKESDRRCDQRLANFQKVRSAINPQSAKEGIQ